MSNLKLSLFGEPQLVDQGRVLYPDRRKALALLAYLALAEGRQSRDVLAALLWPALDQQRARAALRSSVYALSALAPGAWLDTTRETLSLQPHALEIDVHTFLELLARNRTHSHDTGELCDECVARLAQAASLYRADFTEGFSVSDSPEYDDWQLIQREWLRREFAHVLAQLAMHHGAQQMFPAALDYARRWLALDPLHEPAHRMLIRLYATSGQRVEALRQYRQCADLLHAELAMTPDEETTQLFEAIQSDIALAPYPIPAVSRNITSVLPPLPPLLIGRDQALSEIKRRLGIQAELVHPVTVIQGWPGVGKSTIVAALAHDRALAERFPDGVLWASLGETPSLLSELSVWAAALGLHDPSRERTIESLTAQLTAKLSDRRMLLILDDVWRVEHAHAFNLGGPACALLFTSRLNDVAQALAPAAADVYRLQVLAESTALELLRHLAPEIVESHSMAARELVRDLEGLPLAIQVAGRLLHSEARLGWGVGELLAELHIGASLLAAQAPSDMRKLGQETTPTIAALLKRSTDALNAQLQSQFACLGLFVPKPATFDLGAMAAAWDVRDPRPVARVLVNHGLLEPVGSGRFQMHALLVLHARALLEAQA
ncbi:MAG: hypothetical protein H7Z42_03750 [Roseiflexaceae bacterium]|nr:hypothetical protein [Roseiflexaceae bacterium]